MNRASSAACHAALAFAVASALAVTSAAPARAATPAFRDLNHNGVMDPYENPHLSADARVRDLLGRMTLEEKAGAMVHGTARTAARTDGRGNEYDIAANEKTILDGHVNSLITRLAADAATLAEQNNKLQAIAARSRLGIPLTISTDPRNHFQVTEGASVSVSDFSQWPETLGFAAIGDAGLVKRFADIARQEYRAVGIHMALSPQADLATEPRWSRINGTFGEDADLAGRMVAAYVEGFQHGGNGLQKDSIATVVKHWTGYGAAKDGFDSHSYYGRFSAVTAANFDYHVKPYEGAFRAQVAGVMPTYSVLGNMTIDGKPGEQVGAGYNRWLLNDLLRSRYQFKGVILSDWRISEDCNQLCREGSPPGQPPVQTTMGTSWGMETQPKLERFIKGILAGLDQFGGTEESQYLVEAVRKGRLPEARLDESVYRIMLQKMQLGLFEYPFVKTEAAKRTVANPAHRALAHTTQSRSLVLLENKQSLLPLRGNGRKVFLSGVDAKVAAQRGFIVVGDPAQAELAIIRTHTPFQPLHTNFPFGSRQHEGDLDFKDDNPDYQLISRVSARIPVIVSVYLDRPAILTNIKDKAAVLLGDFGVSDAALFDALTGKVKPVGKLPFELASSMAEVNAQKSDLPHDTAHPLYPFSFGLTLK